jgi:NADH dehydrogenase FAD-containing subunit
VSYVACFNFVLISQQLDLSDVQGAVSSTTISYDYLVYAVGAEVQTFGIPGVTEHACFMKELPDAEKVSLSACVPDNLLICW